MRDGVASLPTGAKLLLILSAALLPLALIALFAAIQTNRNAIPDRQAKLSIVAKQSARALQIELRGDGQALRSTLRALERDPADLASCARAKSIFIDQGEFGARFTVRDSANRMVCGTRDGPVLDSGVPDDKGTIVARLLTGEGLVLAVKSPGGSLIARALFPTASIADLTQAHDLGEPYAAALVRGNDRLDVRTIDDFAGLDQIDVIRVPLGIDGTSFELKTRTATFSYPALLAMLVPLLMWAAAACISWFVVDRLLIKPLRDLQARVARYRPGQEIELGEIHALPAQEIRDLGETFRAISHTVSQHEAGLAEGLVRQTRLTREVHHRVKNNLQVISSLISLHARGARSDEASRAYASIQRRVDALAVVHRNHFAEMEETRGLSIRTIVSDLSANIRAGVPDAISPAISVDFDSSLVSQDVATAVSFLITEIVELAMSRQDAAVIRLVLRHSDAPNRALLSITSTALADEGQLPTDRGSRYGRVIGGLARQLRSPLTHDDAAGRYEIDIATTGRE